MDQTPLDIAAEMEFIEISDLLDEKIPSKADEQITQPEPPSPGFY